MTTASEALVGKNFFEIKQKLPSLNEYIKACRTNKYTGAKFKENIEIAIGYFIKMSILEGNLKPVKKPSFIVFEWYEKRLRRDADNIASAKKYILDAMVKNGVLINDTRRYVVGFIDMFLDGDEDFVRVTIKDTEEVLLPH